jgi:hypothetical protein
MTLEDQVISFLKCVAIVVGNENLVNTNSNEVSKENNTKSHRESSSAKQTFELQDVKQ